MNSQSSTSRFLPLPALLLASVVAFAALRVEAQTVVLGTAANFTVLGGATITNTGATVISGTIGGLGSSPGTSVTGFPPGTVIGGSIHANDASATQAVADAQTAFNQLGTFAVTTTLTGQNLGGLILAPGVYFYSAAAAQTGVLTLDGQGQVNPLFVFQIGTTLITTGTSSINFINGATAANTWFQVGSSATLGTGASYGGNIIAQASDTMNTGASLDGRLFALTGAATLDTNSITAPSAVPEPATTAVLIASLAAALVFVKRAKVAVQSES